MQYQKLTVRGLLGRAKRVLTMTKAPDKIKNIEEAMAVFENWLEENGGGAANKNAKTSGDEEKVETVPGLGFKDKAAAEKSLKILEGRDPDYQRLAVKGLIGSSKRVLSGTKDPKKIEDIKEGVKVLEDFIEKFDSENRSRLNRAYLAADIVAQFPKPSDKLSAEFVKVYTEKKNYKHLRTLYPKDDEETSWDIVRNKHVKDLEKVIKEKGKKYFDDDGKPTEEHLSLIYWAYSPQPDKVKSYLEKKEGKGEKRKSSENGDSASKKKK
ncbi:uncharacterized protein LOC134827249 [Culicoides brevitarsis]|uniref:uncharacterized protein LOC134827249 n=1 Tax=Culicoides brevitarsis TaxID=469753 RepID=UPI00307C050F